MQAITVSKFRSNMKQSLDQVEDSSDTIIIPRSGRDREGVVLISLSEYNSLMETLHLTSSPENRVRLLESIAEIEAGEVVDMRMEGLYEILEEQASSGA